MEFQPIACDECGNEVLVHKFSFHQTSVQWTGAAKDGCARIRAAAEAGENITTENHTCPALRASIDRAVLDGRIAVPDDERESGAPWPGLGSPAEAATTIAND